MTSFDLFITYLSWSLACLPVVFFILYLFRKR